jgi:hypothetical protein
MAAIGHYLYNIKIKILEMKAKLRNNSPKHVGCSGLCLVVGPKIATNMLLEKQMVHGFSEIREPSAGTILLFFLRVVMLYVHSVSFESFLTSR